MKITHFTKKEYEELLNEALRCVETLEAFVKNHREILDAKI